jgi:CBS domain-containing protein
MVPTENQNTIHPDASVADAFHMINETRARFLPIVDDAGKYHGVFSAPTLMRMLLPRAATIGMNMEKTRVAIDNLSFMSLSGDDFSAQVEHLKDIKVIDNMSDPVNIPVTAPSTPIMEGMFLIYKYKRHVMLVEPGNKRFVGTLSSNSVLDSVLR